MKTLPTYAQIDSDAGKLVKVTKYLLIAFAVGLLFSWTGWPGISTIGNYFIGITTCSLIAVGFGFRHLLRLQDAKVEEFRTKYRLGDRIMRAAH